MGRSSRAVLSGELYESPHGHEDLAAPTRHLPGRHLALGPHVIACHPCRRYVPLPAIDVAHEPCPFVCAHCGTHGEIKDAADAPADYAHQMRVSGPEFRAAKLRWKPTR
jgi:hypothetical protein